jgi:hypothetical protein
MTYDDKIDNMVFQDFLRKNMTLEDAIKLNTVGWETDEEHSMFKIAIEKILKESTRTKHKLLAKYHRSKS